MGQFLKARYMYGVGSKFWLADPYHNYPPSYPPTTPRVSLAIGEWNPPPRIIRDKHDLISHAPIRIWFY